MEIKFDNTLEGKFIQLRKIEVGDAPEIFKWRSGPSGMFMRQPDNYSVKMQEDWIRSRTDKEINYVIIDKETGTKVGTIGIYDVNPEDKVCNVGRLLLSDEYLGKSNPFGLEALLLTYGYIFEKLNFRKMTGDILATNEPMFKLQVFLGMKQEGYLEKHVVINGQAYDLYIMSIFKDQFETRYKNKINFLLKSFKKAL